MVTLYRLCCVDYINIGRVAELTGIPPVTLRAWERRYGLPKPQRTASGHRLYSMDEVVLVQRLTALMANGYSISRAVAKVREQEDGTAPTLPQQSLPNRWDTYRFRLLAAIDSFDISALESSYSEALSLFPVDRVIDEIMLPVLHQLGDEWEQREDGIAREHFFSAFLRNKIGARFSHEISRVQGPVMVLACLPGESHEMGLMLFGLTASARNHKVIYFGADLPLSQYPPLIDKLRPSAIVLSGSYVELDPALSAGLAQLATRFAGPVYLGGELSEHHREALKALGIIPVGRDFRQGVEAIIHAQQRRRRGP